MKQTTSILAAIIILIAGFYACRAKEETPASKFHDEIMVVHDEVMPKMKDIYRIKKALKKKVKGMEDEMKKSQIQEHIDALEAADDAMMDWMANYKKPKDSDSPTMAYLDDQKDKIQWVKAKMIGSIDQAQIFLDAL